MKSLVFDMDGTLNRFYDVPNWLTLIRNYDATPYLKARPKYDKGALNTLLKELKEEGWHIVVTSWLPKNSTKKYDRAVRVAKREWLSEQEFPYDELHIVKYGCPKPSCTRKNKDTQILFDDDKDVRKSWTLGKTVDASEDILDKLEGILNDTRKEGYRENIKTFSSSTPISHTKIRTSERGLTIQAPTLVREGHTTIYIPETTLVQLLREIQTKKRR